ncbi:hypothetical protein KC340_g12935 [Hortaea werneckii]|nr:hypothetical protein KC342_g6328 [Hortaea werneckii]KAI7098477.1 hypothetical protein KC339_g8911 [Hortaea werneckii]KAI7214075.1 hypothetical protein KC365_g14057 [Hortaea werneckii]KAI7301826.1 hypothetical protein KC340_g12935 [Hortaea werneckii]KAI7377882.1 hypothetical protein KC328_g14187 [Hortaea werneckii]
MLREGADYYSRLYYRHQLGLYTLRTIFGRMYIISSPSWTQAFHRASKTLSFHDLVAPTLQSILGLDPGTLQIFTENLNNERGDRSGVLWEIHDLVKRVLAPGSKSLQEVNQVFFDEIATHLNALPRGEGTEPVELWTWVGRIVSMSSTSAMYGPFNPFALEPSLVDDFWKIAQNMHILFMFPRPWLLSCVAPKLSEARQRVFRALREYFETENYTSGSQLAQESARIRLSKGMTKSQSGQAELSMVMAILINTVPATFWFLTYISADASLLADLRQEVDACTTPTDNNNKHILTATKLRTHCPLLNSALRETLRLAAPMNTTRYVREESSLRNPATGETYLLRKGSLAQIATTVIHQQAEIYGAQALPEEFYAERFLRTMVGEEEQQQRGAEEDPAAGFRGVDGKKVLGSFGTFGGGSSICPGRHFAWMEMLAFTALLIAGFDIVDAGSGGGGPVAVPPFRKEKMFIAQGLRKPAVDPKVVVRRRRGFEDVSWKLEL